MTEDTRKKIRALANLLKARKDAEQLSSVLVLGAGASMRSGCPTMDIVMRQIISKHGDAAVLAKPQEEQLREFHGVIDSLNPSDLPVVFENLFRDAKPSNGYERLASLIKDLYFDIILSTNVDTLLETALEKQKLRRDEDFGLFDLGAVREDEDAGPLILRLTRPTPRIKLVKLHGHLPHGQLKFRREDTLRFPPTLRQWIVNLVNSPHRTVIVVGHSLHDHDIIQCFEQKGGAIWYVNPSEPSVTGFAGSILDSRQGSHHIHGDDGDFDSFFEQLSEAICGPPVTPPPANFLNRVIELYELENRILLPGRPPVTIVTAPLGYGKTYLLRELSQSKKLLAQRWKCCLVPCEDLAVKHERSVMNRLASELGCEEMAGWREISASIGRDMDPEKGYRVCILIDGLDFLPKPQRRKILLGIHAVHEGICAAQGDCRVVFSGRCLQNDLNWMSHQQPISIPPFGQPGHWYSTLQLTEFDEDIVKQLICDVSRRKWPADHLSAMSMRLLRVTGGHPRGLADIVQQDLNKQGWAFTSDPKRPDFYFTPKVEEKLFKQYMTHIVKEIRLRKIGNRHWKDYQTVCALRKLDAEILHSLISRGAIPGFASADQLLTWLLARNLVQEKQPEVWGNGIARGVVVAQMRVIQRNHERYGLLNQVAADSFSELTDRATDLLKSGDLSALRASLVWYAAEYAYHRLQSARYRSTPEPVQERIEAALREIIERLESLNVDDTLWGKTVTSIASDREICFCKQIKDAMDSLARTGK